MELDKKSTKSTGKKASEAKVTKKTTTKPKTTNSTLKKKTTSSKSKSTSSKKSSTSVKKKTSPTSNQSKKTSNAKVVTKKKVAPKKVSDNTSIEEKKYVISETVAQEIEITSPELEAVEEIKKEEKERIPYTNYIIALIAVIWVFIILFLGFQLFEKHQKALYNAGYFKAEGNIKVSNLDEIRQEIVKSSEENIFVLLNSRGEKENYVLEKELSQIIKEYHFENSFYYIDVTDLEFSVNCGVNCVVNQELGTNQVSSLPAIVYLKDKKVIDVAQREDQKVLESADFVKLLDMYEFKK